MPETNETPMTVYEIIHINGDIRTIEVPTSWKVTFGPAIVPRSSTNNYYATRNTAKTMPMAIRFYESKDQQRAIFTEVVSFRDTSLRMQVRQSEEQRNFRTGSAQNHAVRNRAEDPVIPGGWTGARYSTAPVSSVGLDE